jgi:hypothetical protein
LNAIRFAALGEGFGERYHIAALIVSTAAKDAFGV